MEENELEETEDPIIEQDFKLTARQKKFCERYPVLMNGTKAAIEAGYSIDSAAVIATENLRKPNIIAYIEHVQKDAARLVGISFSRNLEELRKIAYSSIAHLHNTWIDKREFEDLTDDEKSCIESIETRVEIRTMDTKGGTEKDREIQMVKVKLYPKLPALDMMNKMLGYNAAEKIEVKEVLTPEERQAKLAMIEAKIAAERKNKDL